MFLISNFVEALAVILSRLLDVYKLVIIAAILLSWVSPDPFNPIVRALRAVTDPVFGFIRRRLPFATIGMLDLSPILVLMFIWFGQMFLVNSLLDLARMLR